MPQNNPNITFLFPFRWLTEDKQFLPVNIRRMIEKEGGRDVKNILQEVALYKVEINYQFKEPIAKFPLTKTQIQAMLKPLIPYGKCVGLFFNYKQHSSQSMLPVLDFRLYFK